MADTIFGFAVEILVKDGYLKPEELKPHTAKKQIEDARKRWLADHPSVKPLYPSMRYRGQEARCRICRDAEWVHPVDENGIPDYSRVVSCGCQKKTLENYRKGISGVPEEHQDTCFETFEPTIPNKDFTAITDLATGKASFKLLLIYGVPGNGKTHLAYSTVVEACKRGVAARYIYAPDMFTAIKAMYDGPRECDPAEQFKVCPFLVIDDVGAEYKTDWTKAMLEEIIDYRYSHQLPTMVTTNNPLDEIPAPVMSRFKDGEISRLIFNKAPDYRPKLRKG